jgi:hypothetical protein
MSLSTRGSQEDTPMSFEMEYETGNAMAQTCVRKRERIQGSLDDMAAQELAVDQCLFVHKERQLYFGLYVDDVEASADDEQLQWLQDRFEERYEIKWLGFNSSEKSKKFVGIRTEIDHVNKIVTQDQTQFIRKAAV